MAANLDAKKAEANRLFEVMLNMNPDFKDLHDPKFQASIGDDNLGELENTMNNLDLLLDDIDATESEWRPEGFDEAMGNAQKGRGKRSKRRRSKRRKSKRRRSKRRKSKRRRSKKR